MKRSLGPVVALAALFFASILHAEVVTKADSVIDMAKSRVSYDIKTTGGEDLVLTADYASTRPNPELVNMDISPKVPIKEGSKVFNIPTKEGFPIEINYSYQGGERIDMKVSTEPSNPSSDTEYSQILSVESKGGYVINFTFIWQGKYLKEVRVEPLINPFAANEA